ncbi:MAG: class I SAM-dependent methyltransferase [Candidatus Heimdallarchaeota archaeon]
MNIFSKVAHKYDKIVGTFDLNSIIDYMPLDDKTLLVDLGGGTGRVAKDLQNYVNDCLVFDLSYEMLQQAKSKTNAFILLQGSSDELPIKSNSINQIFLNDSLHHIRKYRETLDECYRSLKPNGKLIIREFDKKYIGNIFLRFFEFIFGFKSKFFSVKEISTLCQEIGFSVTVNKPNKSTFILVAEKKA